MTAATEVRIVAAEVPGVGTNPDPAAAAWGKVVATTIALAPTPLDRQPSAYVQASWRDRRHGAIRAIEASFATCEGVLQARISWEAADPRPAITDNNVFPDACALLFPTDGKDAPLETMGSAAAPVTLWHWRAGAGAAFLGTASGLGTVERTKLNGLTAKAAWANGRWTVVFACTVNDAGFAVPKARETRVAFAAWSGADSERAGLKSHSPAWTTLVIS